MDTTINPQVMHKAQIIAGEIISGGTVASGMRKAGYSPKTAAHKGLSNRMRPIVADILEDHRASHGKSVMDRINQLSRCADRSVRKISDGTADRLDIEQAKIQASVLKDYADRLGLSLKVNKTASVRLNIESDGPEALKQLKDRIEYLKGLSVNQLDKVDSDSVIIDSSDKEVLSGGYENSTETPNEAQTVVKNDQTDEGIDRLVPDVANV